MILLTSLRLSIKKNKITFRLLWTLFPEGSVIATQFEGFPPEAFRVKNAFFKYPSILVIGLEHIKFDGHRFGTTSFVHTFRPFKDAVATSAIPGFPYLDLDDGGGFSYYPFL
jgi:hypothetical protein